MPQERDPEKLRFGLDTQCPDDIDIVSIELVSEDFHARYNKHSKTYEFLVDAGRPKNPMMRNYATHYPYPLRLAPMQEAAKDLVGTHDFTGFTASGTSVENKVRTTFQNCLNLRNRHATISNFQQCSDHVSNLLIKKTIARKSKDSFGKL